MQEPRKHLALIFFFRVNLGGWFVIEPFITPDLFQRYPGASDEWTLSTLMTADTANGGLNQIEDHYKTFIVINLPSVVIIELILPLDRTRHCRHRCCRTQLD